MTISSINLVLAGPWDRFVSYSGLHLVSIFVCVLAVAALAGIGRTLSDTSKTALRRALSVFAIAYWIVCYTMLWYRDGLDLPSGLPLHICELNSLIAPLALLTLNRWLRATAYFWTFALTTQAFVQPTLTTGPAGAFFWLFWAQHTIVLACAVYDLAVVGFRPNWQDLLRVYVVSVIYLAIVVPLNLEFGMNFGFLGNPPPARVPPFVDALGPWPWRALTVVALAAAGFAILVLPWRGRTSHKPT
ncbi:MAG: TIGR02206 family membrane protein [Methyloceanibacter sp.]|nr:TIGR02206 family membrane protein [Methyloceanibacter sp.]